MGELLFNRYEVLSVLGRGAMGEVFEVRDIQSENHYALKHIPSDLTCDNLQLESVRQNFRLVSGLTHPHIGTTRHLEINPESQEAYLLMDLIHGGDLAHWLKTKREELGDSEAPLPIKLVLGIAEQIAHALDYAHSQPCGKRRMGILHRDLKPANVMVEKDREYRPGIPFIRLVDFGLAAEIQTTLQGISTTDNDMHSSGTPAYMAPEQWEGRTLTRGVDQWGLAVMIYEMVSGRRPFTAPTAWAMMEVISKADPEIPETLSPAQWKALKKSFSSNRRERYPSCVVMVKALAEADNMTSGLIQVCEIPLPDEFTATTAFSSKRIKKVRKAPPKGRWVPGLVGGVLVSMTLLFFLLSSDGQKNSPSKTKVDRREDVRKAFGVALELAVEAKKRGAWKQIVQYLQEPLEALGTQEHPSRNAAELLLREAKVELDKRTRFARKLSGAESQRIRGNLPKAKQLYEEALALWPDSQQNSRIKKGISKTLDVMVTRGKQRIQDSQTQEMKREGWHLLRIAAEGGRPEAQVDIGRRNQEGLGIVKDLDRALRWYRKAADQGHTEAQNRVGNFYAEGWAVPQDEVEALKWYRRAALKNHAEAQHSIAVCYKEGRGGLKVDLKESAKWLRKSAEQGFAKAQNGLGWMYLLGKGVPYDLKEALRWVRIAAEQGNAASQRNLGLMYISGRGVAKDRKEGAKWIRKAAAQGYSKGQVEMGILYEQGRGVPKNFAEALRWYTLSAKQGEPRAMNNLGLFYRDGKSVAANPKVAFYWFKKAADLGQPLAQVNLARMYKKGWGVLINLTEAERWYRKAADQGNAFAQFNLGYFYHTGKKYPQAMKWYRLAGAQNYGPALNNMGQLYLQGLGVPMDPSAAYSWFLKGAKRSNSHAQYNVGLLHELGKGATKDLNEARKWFRFAAEQGHASAQVHLGHLYHKGLGIPADGKEALKWYLKAAEQGDTKAYNLLGNLYEAAPGIPRNEVEAILWYRKAARAGRKDAQEVLKRQGYDW